MPTVIYDETEVVDIPAWVVNLRTFQRWLDSDQFPERGKVWFIRGEVWADMSWEQVFTHGQVKNAIAFRLTAIVQREKIGRFFPDGLRIVNVAAEISGSPDGTFVSFETLKRGKARYVSHREGGVQQIRGTPDLVVEVVSKSSVDKDTEWLQKAYWEAGIPEYWLVDARESPLSFQILKRTARGYVPVRKVQGWTKSAVLNREFRLIERINGLGQPDYRLAER